MAQWYRGISQISELGPGLNIALVFLITKCIKSQSVILPRPIVLLLSVAATLCDIYTPNFTCTYM